MRRKVLYFSVILILLTYIAGAAPEDQYKITYTINVKDDGTAIWNVEYRTLLLSREDFDSFDNYTRQLDSVHLQEFKELMQKSVLAAANATSRKMAAGGFTGNAKVQSAPTGTYGVVSYSFTWMNFAKVDPNKSINIGDVFVGGLYLSKDNTLMIQYPSGYTVEQVTPQPDQERDGMIWYGLRQFAAGEPSIVLSKISSPWIPSAVAIFVVAVGAFIYIRKIRREKEFPKDIPENITETDIMDLEDRIVKLLKESGGSLYQSEIGKKLNIPKSTVSSVLNELHDRNVIQKIKKGRENLIRLV